MENSVLRICDCYTGELAYDGPLYARLLAMTDIPYISSVCHMYKCIFEPIFPGPIESVMCKFTGNWKILDVLTLS